jgi:crossover junction endodeoxyribonuclease RuvC
VRILGVDPGTRVLGYGVIEIAGRDCRYVECGVLTGGKDARMERRLGEIARGLQEVIAEMAPDAIAVEQAFTRVNPRSALALAQARGVVLAVAGMSGVAVHSYAPAVVKKTVTGRGSATKEQMVRMVQALIGLRRPPSADAADALAIALTHARRGGHW